MGEEGKIGREKEIRREREGGRREKQTDGLRKLVNAVKWYES